MTVPTNEDRYGEFAAKQLIKYGWKAGKGLGREGEGVTRAISLAKKDDSKGLGSGSDTWGFAWWDHVYNKSSSTIKVEKGDSGVMLSTSGKGSVERNNMGIISTERPSKRNKEKKEKKKSKKNKKSVDIDDKSDVEDTVEVTTKPASMPIWMRGTFVASTSGSLTGTFESNGWASNTNKMTRTGDATSSDSSSESDDDARDYSVRITDAELFTACEGRTARKGARVEQPAKLARLEVLPTSISPVMKRGQPGSNGISSEQRQMDSEKLAKKKRKRIGENADTKDGSLKKKEKKDKKDKKVKKVKKDKRNKSKK